MRGEILQLQRLPHPLEENEELLYGATKPKRDEVLKTDLRDIKTEEDANTHTANLKRVKKRFRSDAEVDQLIKEVEEIRQDLSKKLQEMEPVVAENESDSAANSGMSDEHSVTPVPLLNTAAAQSVQHDIAANDDGKSVASQTTPLTATKEVATQVPPTGSQSVSLQSGLSTAGIDIDDLKETLTSLWQDINADNESRITTMEMDLRTQHEKNSSLRDRADELEEQLEQQKKELVTSLASQKGQLTEDFERQVAGLKEEQRVLQERYDELETEKNGLKSIKAEDASRLEKQQIAHHEAVGELQRRMDELVAKHEQTLEEKEKAFTAEMNQKVAMKEQDYDKLMQENDSNKRLFSDAMKQVADDFKEKLTQMQTGHEKEREKLKAGLVGEQQRLTREKGELKYSIKTLTDEHEKLKKHTDSVKTDLVNMGQEKDELQRSNQQLGTMTYEMASALVKTLEPLAALEAVDDLGKELADAQDINKVLLNMLTTSNGTPGQPLSEQPASNVPTGKWTRRPNTSKKPAEKKKTPKKTAKKTGRENDGEKPLSLFNIIPPLDTEEKYEDLSDLISQMEPVPKSLVPPPQDLPKLPSDDQKTRMTSPPPQSGDQPGHPTLPPPGAAAPATAPAAAPATAPATAPAAAPEPIPGTEIDKNNPEAISPEASIREALLKTS